MTSPAFGDYQLEIYGEPWTLSSAMGSVGMSMASSSASSSSRSAALTGVWCAASAAASSIVNLPVYCGARLKRAAPRLRRES